MALSRILQSLAVLQLLHLVSTSPIDHKYNVGDEVPLYVNKIGPSNNPSETYRYYELPFCQPENLLPKARTFSEVLSGDHLTNSLYDLKFQVAKTDAVLCHKKLGRGDIGKFRDAVANDYYFQMYYDDLPFWGFIGKVERGDLAADGEGPKYFLFNHVQFDALYSGNQIIEIRAFCDPNHSLDITEKIDMDVDFTYSIFWNETSTQFKSRMEKYSRASLLTAHQKIHWFSLSSSIGITICLVGMSLFFLRHLKNNLMKLSAGDEEEDKDGGWKFLHGDVLKSPPDMPLLCAVLGTGTQLLIMVFLLFALAFAGIVCPHSHGSIYSWSLLTYALTHAISGYVSVSFCSSFTEFGWERSVFLASLLLLCPSVVVVFILNLLSVYVGAIEVLPLRTMFVVFLGYVLVGSPLLAIGGMLGHKYKCGSPVAPVIKKVPRDIPSLPWYKKTYGEMLIGGLLPLSAMAPELQLLYSSLWGYKISVVTWVLFITLIILIQLTATLSIILTYFQLTVDDDKWCWRSILRGGAAGISMFLYSILFYWKSNMSGFLQTAIFFGYTACFCFAFFLMLGAVSFFASFMFLRRIQHAVKSE